MTIFQSVCPVCSSDATAFAIKAKDYTVSGEEFEIWECSQCTVRFTQNIPDANSIGHYYRSEQYISHSDNTEGLVGTLYYAVRTQTLRQKKELVKKFTKLKSGTLLDIGAGVGAFAGVMKENDWQVTALEPDAKARETALSKYDQQLQDTSELFDLPENRFDAVTMWHVLEHVHDLDGYAKKIHSLLKSAGKLFIAVPNYTSGDAKKYQQYWAAYDVPRHLYHFSPASMKTLLTRHGFKLVNMKPMWFDSFYVSMLSEKYKRGNLAMLPAITSGVISNLKAFSHTEKCSSVIYIAGK